MDLTKLTLNKKILTIANEQAKPDFGKTQEIREAIPYKKVMITHHAFDRFLERTCLTKEQVTVIDVAKFIIQNRGISHFEQFNNNKDERKVIDKHVILKVRFGSVPFLIVLVVKEDAYILKTLYFDWSDVSLARASIELFEKEKADKEFTKMLIDNFFGSQKEKDEFDKLNQEEKETKIKSIYNAKKPMSLLTHFSFNDILKSNKQEFKNIRIDNGGHEFNRPKTNQNPMNEIKVSANEFKENSNWQPEFIDVDLDLELEENDEE